MNRRLHDLNRRIISYINRRICGQWHLRQTEGSRVRIFARADDLHDGGHGERHVLGTIVGAIGAESEIKVEEGGGVTLKPAGLNGDGAAVDGPESAVGGSRHAAA